MELLAPAGNYEAFLAAINAGCDAVYLGGSKFGARAYADNFSDEEIIRAISYAHLFNVKVYLTVNTLIKEREFEDVLDYIMPFYNAGLDACIVQDIGLISVFKEYFPLMECHVSTQGFITGKESVSLMKELGAERVVLARELTLKEIKEIKKNIPVEIETFIHGAMCYSYSGACLFSSCLGGRSGNRGRCAGPCRLPYSVNELNKEDSYVLSMKDQCTIEIIPELIDAGIDSLKIEGRMKKPEYVAFVTSMYRKYIDLYVNNPDKFKVDKRDLDNLSHIYLRSEKGYGYYHEQNGRDMISLTNPAYSGNDENLMREIREKYILNNKKLPISFEIYLSSNEPMVLNAYFNEKFVSVEGDIISESINIPATEEDIINKLSKLGDTPFYLKSVSVSLNGNLFVPVKALNELRRKAVSLLIASTDTRNEVNIVTKAVECRKNNFTKNPIVTVLSKEQYDALKEREDINLFIPYELYNGLKGNKLFINLPYVVRNKDIEKIKVILSDSCVLGVIANNYETLALIQNSLFRGMVIAGPSLYTWNKFASKIIYGFADFKVLPYELNQYEWNDIKEEKAYFPVYGRLPLMQTANCIYKTVKGCNKFEGPEFVTIKDRMNICFPVKRNCELCYNTVYNSVPTLILQSDFKYKPDLDSLYISFTTESGKECMDVINMYISHENVTIKDYTKGYFKRGVE